MRYKYLCQRKAVKIMDQVSLYSMELTLLYGIHTNRKLRFIEGHVFSVQKSTDINVSRETFINGKTENGKKKEYNGNTKRPGLQTVRNGLFDNFTIGMQ